MNKNKIFINIATEFAKLSKCQKIQVCCLLVKNNRIISTGLNGTPSGYTNCSDAKRNNLYSSMNEHHEWSKYREIHGEMNAIIFAARNGINISSSVAYVTHRPCMDCTKCLVAAGIKEIFYKEEYDRNKNEELEKFLKECEVKCEKIV